MPIEEKLEKAKREVEREIKIALMDKGMTQAELANLLNESRSKVNQAIKGNTNPKSIEIRKKIYKVLGMNN
ncbi:helix-turn-helix domain-containing protein [Lactobacillus sp. PSON]|uniref:helix-turn-helix domain-containing protein n=1 Tax=Lactobacillus sp. PSON TaxID=3455454 RepID=UPI004042EFC0